jgi:flagellar protein FlgJ
VTTPVTGPARPAATSSLPAKPDEKAQLQKVAKQFEAVFLRQMIGSMRKADLADGAFDSSATEQFRDMADARTADNMAEKGGFGVADLMMRQFAAKAVSKVTPPAPKALTGPAVDSPK